MVALSAALHALHAITLMMQTGVRRPRLLLNVSSTVRSDAPHPSFLPSSPGVGGSSLVTCWGLLPRRYVTAGNTPISPPHAASWGGGVRGGREATGGRAGGGEGGEGSLDAGEQSEEPARLRSLERCFFIKAGGRV